MRFELIPGTSGKPLPPTATLDARSLTPLEDTILGYRGIRFRLRLTRAPEVPEETLVIGYESDDTCSAYIFVPKADLIERYGNYLPLNEQEFSFADKEGTTPDQEWFEKRNRKLGINWSSSLDSWVVPPRSLVNVALSYAFSSMGEAKFEHDLIEDCDYRVRRVVRIWLHFYGSEEKNGWHEESVVLVDRLEQHIKRRRN